MLKKLEPLERMFRPGDLEAKNSELCSKHYSRTPIRQDVSRDVQSLNPPDLRVLRATARAGGLRHLVGEKSQNSKSLSFSPLSPILTQKDKVHQKFKSEYNAFMNKFESQNEVLNSKSETQSNQEFRPLVGDTEEPDFIFPTKVPIPQSFKTSELLFSPKESSKKLFLNSLSCLEESSETIPLSKKQIDVWDDGTKVPYKTFRQGPKSEDSIIFVLPPESELEDSDYLFIGYSKKQLYEEYMLVGHDSFFILDIIEEESYIIPMHQIVRILENSHVLYIIEKMNMSGFCPKENSCFAIMKPCKFQN